MTVAGQTQEVYTWDNANRLHGLGGAAYGHEELDRSQLVDLAPELEGVVLPVG